MSRSVLTVLTAVLLCLSTVLAGAASAVTAGGTKGDPQPELKPFKIGTAISAGSVAVEQNGDLVVAYDVKSGSTGQTFVCVLARGSLGVNAAALAGNDIIFSPSDTGGAYVEAIPVTASGPPSRTATAKAASDIGDGSYAGGALVASDYLSTDYTTYVAFAPSGKNFDQSASWHNVGSFPHEQLVGISGGALLTIQTTGKQNLELRLFNGTGFGPAHVVPSNGGGAGSYTIDQDGNGMVHVFTDDSRSAPSYHLFEVSSFSGTTWSKAVNLGSAVQDNGFAVAVDSTGSGLVLGTGAAFGYPVLAPQDVSFSLASSKITVGGQTTGSGTVSPAAPGRQVELQVEKSGLWYTTATTSEAAGGDFKFTIRGTAAGTFDYRAVAADLPGYQLYGYSPAQSLQVTS